MQPDLAQLRVLLRDDPGLSALFTLLRRVRVRANVTSLKNLVKANDAYRGGSSRECSDRLLQSFRLLESCGFGRLHDHTRRDRARFEWAIHPGIVADIASQPGATFLPHHLLLSGATLPAGSEPPSDPAGRQRHSFPLRPDAEATLLLPPDLTAGEARRLGHYLLSLARD